MVLSLRAGIVVRGDCCGWLSMDRSMAFSPGVSDTATGKIDDGGMVCGINHSES